MNAPSAEALALHEEAANLPDGSPSFALPGARVDCQFRPLRIFAPKEGSANAYAAVLEVFRAPAQFYRLTTCGLKLETGSGCELGLLLCRLGQEIAEGMIVVDKAIS